MSMDPSYTPDAGNWICANCGGKLIQEKIQAHYLNSAFDVLLPRCPQCNMTLIPKSLAEGKMLEVESLLEDK